MTVKHVIVGLGNPGPQFENTRHNAGFDVMRALAGETAFSHVEALHADIAVVKIDDHDVALVCPTTGMNDSGDAVKAVLDHYELGPEALLVVHDDVTLSQFAMLRFQHSGKAGGHHGIEHTVQLLNSNEFDRLKVGVGPDPGGAKRFEFVLAKMDDIRPRYLALVGKSADAVRLWVNSGVAIASCQFNKKVPHA